MCGIIGYRGHGKASDIILKGLKKLEYRGYDSWGIAISGNSKIGVVKKVGTVPEFCEEVSVAKGGAGIGHTRWATHGGITEKNAHPHLSNNGKIAVVHNGIIQNHREQRKFLEGCGFKFLSQTDTENIPHTIEYHMKKGYDFFEASKRALKHLKGQYAIVAINDEGKLVAVRKEAPLVVGVGKNGEYFIASDITAFIDHTKSAIFLEEYDFVSIDETGIRIFNLAKDSFVERPVASIDWDPEQAKKGNFDHFFMKEIAEQAETMERIASMDTEVLKDAACEIKAAKDIYLVACGTASYATLHAMYLFSKIVSRRVQCIVASEFRHFQHLVTPDSVVIAVSQSGETADTIDAVKAAKKAGAKVISITNVMHSSIVRESHRSIFQKVGPEIAVNSTKAYTSQLAILTLLAYELAGNLNEGLEKIRELPRRIYYLTSMSVREHLKRLAERLMYAEHLFLFGRGVLYPTALEASHKIKEVTYIHAEAYPGGETKHGMIALIEQKIPCIVFTSEETFDDMINNATELKTRGAYIIGVGPKNSPVFDFYIKVREAGDFNSICQIIPMQILSYQLAVLRGCDPDKPRNLAKSVTVK